MNACITVKPKLYINESLTPNRRSLFKIIWEIRKQHRDLFQQCYTQEEKIYVKVSNQRHIITTDETLNEFLDKYPILKQTSTQCTRNHVQSKYFLMMYDNLLYVLLCMYYDYYQCSFLPTPTPFLPIHSNTVPSYSLKHCSFLFTQTLFHPTHSNTVPSY